MTTSLSDRDLGPLPEPARTVDIFGHDCPLFTREQMRAERTRAYDLGRASRDAEVERLREALRELLDPAINEDGEWYRQARAIAREALKEKP